LTQLEHRNTGTVDCALFDGPLVSIERCVYHECDGDQSGIHRRGATFADIPPGTYALAVIHDENSNGKLDTNWLIPRIHGFSNDAKVLLARHRSQRRR
jgi:uncharacterized protein (DUF2141 family)